MMSHGYTSQIQLMKPSFNALGGVMLTQKDNYTKKQLHLKWKDIMTYHKIITKPCRYVYIYIYVEPVCPLFGGFEPSKRRHFPTKTRVIWVPGISKFFLSIFLISWISKKTKKNKPSETERARKLAQVQWLRWFSGCQKWWVFNESWGDQVWSNLSNQEIGHLKL